MNGVDCGSMYARLMNALGRVETDGWIEEGGDGGLMSLLLPSQETMVDGTLPLHLSPFRTLLLPSSL